MHIFLDLLLIFSILTNLVLALYVLIKRYKSNYSIPFFIMCIGVTIWIISNYYFQNTESLDEAFIFNKLANVGALILSVGVYFFSLTFPQLSRNKFKLSLKNYFYIIISFIFILLLLFSDLVDSVVTYSDDGVKLIQAGFLKKPFYLLILFGLVAGFYNFVSKYRKTTSLFKFQIGVFLFSLSVSIIGGVTFNLLLPALNNFNFIILGPAFTVFGAIASVYCMVNYRYTDFRIILSEIIEKIILVAILIFISIVVQQIISQYFPSKQMLARIILYSIFGTIFVIVVNIISLNFIKKALFVPDYETVLNEFNKKSLNYTKIEHLIEDFKTQINTVVPVQNAYILFKENSEFKNINFFLNEIFKNTEDSIVIYDEENKKFLEGFEDNLYKIKAFKCIKKNYNANVIVKLTYLNNLVGYLLLGDKLDNQAFTKYDIKFIKSISETFATYIYKLQLYLDIQGFNQVLQQKIDVATSELQKQKSQLEEKYQFEKDMIGIMGHELRTPMTVARGMAELLLRKIDNKFNLDTNYLKEKLEKIFDSIIKEASLIQTMLSTSHIDNNKVNLQLTEFDLIETIEFAIMSFKKDADLKNLKLTFVHPDEKLPHMINDQSRVQEIVNNLISNAIKYTNQGSVTVNVKKVNDFVEYSVKDSGIGIPQSEINNIGRKFYRIHQHLDEKKDVVRAGGTGLGLYVVKGLLEAMGGELRVESEEGKGSTFTAVFPIEVKENDRLIFSSSGSDTNDMFEKLGFKTK